MASNIAKAEKSVLAQFKFEGAYYSHGASEREGHPVLEFQVTELEVEWYKITEMLQKAGVRGAASVVDEFAELVHKRHLADMIADCMTRVG